MKADSVSLINFRYLHFFVRFIIISSSSYSVPFLFISSNVLHDKFDGVEVVASVCGESVLKA